MSVYFANRTSDDNPEYFYGYALTVFGELFIKWFAPETIILIEFTDNDNYSAIDCKFGVCDNSKAQEIADKITDFKTENDFFIAPTCTPFQKIVWAELLKTTVGEQLTYSELAKRTGNPNSTRAVANAVAQNKIALLIPCHRIIPKIGGTGRYKWGNSLKKKILAVEYETALTRQNKHD